jgi:hypothetical protein
MPRQDSDSGLERRLAAHLTPPVVRMRPARGTQSSGFFDLTSMFANYMEEARPAPLLRPPEMRALLKPPPPLPKRAPPPLPEQAHARRPKPVAGYLEPAGVPTWRRAVPQPIGWFAILVTWLATTTLAVLCATQVTGHARPSKHAVSVPAPAAVPAPATAPAPVAARAPAAATGTATATATAPGTASAVVATAPAATATSSTPVFSINDLPRVTTKTAAPVQRIASHTRAAPVAAPAPAPPPVEHVAAAPPAPKPAPEAAPAPKAAPVAAAAAPAAAAPAPAPGSLEDLIRREVAAEQKRLHSGAAH